jgi:pimeloyl-ACP methyl ester carboxylesterase
MRAKNVVLVHGAWADGSSWSGVIQRLQAEGYRATAVQIPMASRDEDVIKTRQVLAAQNGPTILVAHSYGGAVITQLGADAPNVVALVYVSAFVPAEGESMKGLITGGPQPAGAAAFRPDPNGFIWLDQDGLVRFFAPDVDPVQARVLAAVQQPISVSAFLGDEPFGPPAWASFKSWFLVSEQDQMIPPAAQHFMAQRTGATVSSVVGSHTSLISHADVVAALIQTAAEAVASGS